MQWKKVVEAKSSPDPEVCWLAGYNATGAQIDRYCPVCWNLGSADGFTIAAPATTNIRLAAGIVQETVGTACYTYRIQAYGVTYAKTYGVATNFVPGAQLVLVNAKTYLAYGTDGEASAQIPCAFIALDTNATATANSTGKVFVRLL